MDPSGGRRLDVADARFLVTRDFRPLAAVALSAPLLDILRHARPYVSLADDASCRAN